MYCTERIDSSGSGHLAGGGPQTHPLEVGGPLVGVRGDEQLPRLLHVGVQLVAGRGRVVKQEGAAVGQLAAPGNTTISIRTIPI